MGLEGGKGLRCAENHAPWTVYGTRSFGVRLSERREVKQTEMVAHCLARYFGQAVCPWSVSSVAVSDVGNIHRKSRDVPISDLKRKRCKQWARNAWQVILVSLLLDREFCSRLGREKCIRHCRRPKSRDIMISD